MTVPVGWPFSLSSSIALVFDSSGDRLQYTETLVSENEAGKFAIATYLGGTQTSNQATDLAASQTPRAKDANLSMDKNTGACIAAVGGASITAVATCF